jgi:hypothetical protein
MNDFFQGKDCREIYEALSVEQELDALDKIDKRVDEMLTYPEAEAILNKVMKQGEGND